MGGEEEGGEGGSILLVHFSLHSQFVLDGDGQCNKRGILWLSEVIHTFPSTSKFIVRQEREGGKGGAMVLLHFSLQFQFVLDGDVQCNKRGILWLSEDIHTFSSTSNFRVSGEKGGREGGLILILDFRLQSQFVLDSD